MSIAKNGGLLQNNKLYEKHIFYSVISDQIRPAAAKNPKTSNLWFKFELLRAVKTTKKLQALFS